MPGGPLVIIPLPSSLSYPPTPPTSNWSELTPANTNCTYGIHWIYNFMGQCVMDGRGMAAMICGFICLFAWILNGVPQIIENFRTGIPDQAMSPFLLLFWTLGDVSNFVGCILAHQLILQVVISVYSIASDFVLISQFIYYKARHKFLVAAVNQALGDGQMSAEVSESEDSDDQQSLLRTSADIHARSSTRTLAVCFVGVVGLTVCTTPILWTESTSRWSPHVPATHIAPHGPTARRLLQLVSSENATVSDRPVHSTFLTDTGAKIGYLLGSISTVMYLSSRFPQILQNWRRGSTEGLCLGLFCLALIGNASYGLQIFLTSLYPVYLLQSLPWLIGSVGVLGLDLVICFQFYYYSFRSRKSPQPPPPPWPQPPPATVTHPDACFCSESRKPSEHNQTDEIASLSTESV